MILAIHISSSIVFEGDHDRFSAIEPRPYLSEIFNSDPFKNRSLFREDLFDPITKIRRGRIYEIEEGVHKTNYVLVNFGKFPAPDQSSMTSSYLNITLFSINFQFFKKFIYNSEHKIENLIIYLGDFSHRTAWRIVGIEKLFNGETLFTLKSLSALGTLPELIEEKLPEGKKKEIREGFEKVVAVAPIQIAESVVDVCREFARLLLAEWLLTVGVAVVCGDDLGKLIKKIPQDKWVGIRNAASIINRLHPRGKSSERDRQAGSGQEIRPLSNEDASLAVSLIGFLLRDFGWAA